jgi:hypothetical protein
MEFEKLTEAEANRAMQLIREDNGYLPAINAAKQLLISRHKNEVDYLYNAIVLEYNKLSEH